MRLIDPVDENEMRDAKLIQRAQGRGCQRRSCWIRVDDDDRDVGDGERPRTIGREADRAGTIEDGELVAEIFEIVEVELRRAAALPSFGARIADAGAVGRRSQSI